MRSRWKLRSWRSRIGLVALVAVAAAAAFGAQVARSTSKASDTIVIAIPGTPQGTDLDREAGPQSWTIAGQVLELGIEWKRIPYPFAAHGGIQNTKVPGF